MTRQCRGRRVISCGVEDHCRRPGTILKPHSYFLLLHMGNLMGLSELVQTMGLLVPQTLKHMVDGQADSEVWSRLGGNLKYNPACAVLNV